MPLINSPQFTSLDVQDRMIALLNADAYIQAAILTAANAFNPVVDDDPSPGKVSVTENMRLVFTLAAETEDDATLGALSGGTADVVNTFAVMLYVADQTVPGGNKDPAKKRLCVQTTGIVRQALMRYRQGTGIPAGATQQGQLWWSSRFRKHSGGSVTAYDTPLGCRFSLTLIDIYSRIGYN